MSEETIVGMYDLLEALEAVIQAVDPSKRATLDHNVTAMAFASFVPIKCTDSDAICSRSKYFSASNNKPAFVFDGVARNVFGRSTKPRSSDSGDNAHVL